VVRAAGHHLLLVLKGMAMGAADVVPGVSGGTIAFITNIYEELIDSLRNCDWGAVQALFKGGPVAFWRHINGFFLLSVFGGVLISLLTLSRLITYCLENYPILVWAFFFGLVCASILFVARQLNHWRRWEVLALVAGTVIAFVITLAKPANLPGTWWVMSLAGAVAICAMILPGVSGSFLLLLMGLYSTLLQALNRLDFALLLSFAGGAVIGLLAFSHLLSWLLHRYHGITLGFLTGFLVGSLNMIWPWKRTVETFTNRHGEVVPLVQENVMPQTYERLIGDPQWLLALGCAIVGIGLVLVLEWLAKATSKT